VPLRYEFLNIPRQHMNKAQKHIVSSLLTRHSNWASYE
jgi:hypothetical protein